MFRQVQSVLTYENAQISKKAVLQMRSRSLFGGRYTREETVRNPTISGFVPA